MWRLINQIRMNTLVLDTAPIDMIYNTYTYSDCGLSAHLELRCPALQVMTRTTLWHWIHLLLERQVCFSHQFFGLCGGVLGPKSMDFFNWASLPSGKNHIFCDGEIIISIFYQWTMESKNHLSKKKNIFHDKSAETKSMQIDKLFGTHPQFWAFFKGAARGTQHGTGGCRGTCRWRGGIGCLWRRIGGCRCWLGRSGDRALLDVMG